MQSSIDRPPRGSDGATLTAAQLRLLRGELESMFDDYRACLRRNEEVFRALSPDGTLDGDERESARARAEAAYDALQDTNGALTAMLDGTYGVCLGCRRPIPFEHLEAAPRVRVCAACSDA